MMKKILPHLIAALTSGLLLSSLFEPYNQLSALWFALVPLLLVIRHSSVKAAWWTGVLAGFISWIIQLYWLYILKDNGGPLGLVWIAWVGLPLYLSLYLGAFAATAAKLRHLLLDGDVPATPSWKRIFLVAIAEPAIWVTMELLRSTLFTGFAWNPLGLAFASTPVFLQPAAIGGMSLVSALIVGLNGAVATLGERFWWALHRQLPKAFAQKMLFFVESAIPFLFMLTAFLWGFQRIKDYDARLAQEATHLPVALQATTVPCIFELSSNYQNPVLKEMGAFAAHIEFLHTVLPALKETPVALWLTPESSLMNHNFRGLDPINRAIRGNVLQHASRANVPLLLGGCYQGDPIDNQTPLYNCAILATQSGYDLSQVYGKRHLVPFGEYIFFDKTFPFLQRFVPAGLSCTPGERSTIQLPSGHHFGPLICFDDVDANLSRQSVLDGAQFLVNISNDAWYTPSAQPKAHLQQAIARCVETGVPMARTSNRGGISFIDGVGRARYYDGQPTEEKLAHLSELSNLYFMEENMLIITLPLLATPFASIYLTWGEATFAAPCVLFTFAFLVWCFLKPRAQCLTCKKGLPLLLALLFTPSLFATTESDYSHEDFAQWELLPISGMAIDDQNVSLAESTAKSLLMSLGIASEERAKAEEILIRADIQKKNWSMVLERVEKCADLPFERRITFQMYAYCGLNDYATVAKLYNDIQLPFDTEWGIAALRIAILANLKLKNNIFAAEHFKIVDESPAVNDAVRAANALAWNIAFPSPSAREALLSATETVKSESLLLECARALPIVFKSEAKEKPLAIIQERLQTIYAPTTRAKLLLVSAELTSSLVEKITLAKQAETTTHDIDLKMQIFTFIGETYLATEGNVTEGIAYLQKAVTINPSHESAPYLQLRIAETLVQEGKIDDAIQAYRRYRESFHTPALYVRSQQGYARTLMLANRPQDALVAFLDAAEKTTDNEEEIKILLEAAEAATIAQRPAKAISIYRDTLKLNPVNRQDIQLLLARTLETNNEKDEAEKLYFEICEKSNTSPANLRLATLRLGALYVESERLSEAIALYSKVIAATTDKDTIPHLLLARGKLYYRTERYEQAQIDFEKIATVTITEIQTEAQFFLVTTLYYLGKEDQARALANNYLTANPNNRRTPDVTLWIAKNDFNNGQYAKAIEGFNTFINQNANDPRIPNIRYFTARAHFLSENYSETIETVTNLIKLHPTVPYLQEARYLQAKALMGQARFEEALTILNDITRRALDATWIGEAYGSLGECLRITSASDPKRESLALAAYRDAIIRLDESDPEKSLLYILEIGRIYERQKHFNEALQQYSRIIYRILDNPELYSQASLQYGLRAFANFERIEKSVGNYESINLLYNRIQEAAVPHFNP